MVHVGRSVISFSADENTRQNFSLQLEGTGRGGREGGHYLEQTLPLILHP